MKKSLFLLLLVAGFLGCQQEVSSDHTTSANDPMPLQVLTDPSAAWQYEQLQLVPILADEDFIRQNAATGELKTMAEAMDIYGFRISEKKPFGRFEDRGAVNSLTVQNKTEFPIFIMGGDIVQGGRQDRVAGEDQVIAARSLRDIPVFCVEPGRWHYQDVNEEEITNKPKNHKIFAFSGYYHVAAGDIRSTLSGNKSQQEVWEKVGRLTNHYQVNNQTGTYAALEDSEEFTRKRDAYLRFFDGKFSKLENVVGVMAVSGNRIIATDVFGHPELFQKQIGALLYSYATDAITSGQAPQVDFQKLQTQLNATNESLKDPAVMRFNGAVIHHFSAAAHN